MDDQRFDRFARIVAAPRTRRQTIAALGAALSAALFGAGRKQSVQAGALCAITCPANVITSNDINQCGAVVNYAAPVTIGTCGTVTCTPASGSFFPPGTTTITCTESTVQAQCSFTITVNDTQPPSITCPADITVESPDPATVNYTVPTGSDNCPAVTVVCSPPSGSTFAIGQTAVSCTATDTAQNTATCSFNVTVALPSSTPTETATETPTEGPTETATEPGNPTATEIPATEVPATEAPATVVPPAPTTAPVVELPNTGAGGGGSEDKLLPVAIAGAGVALLARLGLRRTPNRE
jgi:hypothetical protein